MKRILSIIICVVVLLGLFGFSVSAAEGSFSHTNSEAAIGSSFTTSYTVGSGEIAQAHIKISTPSQLELTSVSAAAKGWNCAEQNGGYLISPTDSTSVLKGTSPLISLTFKVLENAEVGSSANVSLECKTSPIFGEGADTAEGNQDISGSFSIKITQSPQDAASSDDSSTPKAPTLSALSIENAKISPQFNPKTFVYDVTVPYEVEKLNVTATPEDPSCKVTVEDTLLSDTEVTSVAIKLRSSAGNSMYNLRVTREQRQTNSNNKLSAISAQGFLLSPVFSPGVTQYVVWVPFETTEVNIAATPESEFSTVTVTGGKALKPGEFNKITVACTSESGLINEYYLSVYRAAEGEGIVLDGTTVKNEQTNSNESNGSKVKAEENNKDNKSNPILPIALGFLAGAAMASIVALALIKGWFKKLFVLLGSKENVASETDEMFFDENYQPEPKSGNESQEDIDGSEQEELNSANGETEPNSASTLFNDFTDEE